MRKIAILLLAGLIAPAFYTPAFGWWEKGHEIIANIAEAHLNPRAKKEVLRLLDGHRMAYYSSWMDEIRNDSVYSFTRTWHYANVDEGKTYETMDRIPEGDVVTATMLSIEKLKDRSLTDSVRAMYLKFVIHTVGDMHCPMHAGRATDIGGNTYKVVWRNDTINLHRLWDGTVVDAARSWTSIEWSTYIDATMSPKQLNSIAAGSPLDWFKETVALAKDIYDSTPENKEVPRNYARKYSPLIESQFLKGGCRLAWLLNSIL